MRKRFSGMAWVVIILLLMSCSNREQYILENESEHWEAKLKVVVNKEGMRKDLLVTYKGELEELADIGRLEYSYSAAEFSGKSEVNFNGKPPQKKTFSAHGGSNQRSFDRDQSVNVTIKWDGKEETMKLKE